MLILSCALSSNALIEFKHVSTNKFFKFPYLLWVLSILPFFQSLGSHSQIYWALGGF